MFFLKVPHQIWHENRYCFLYLNCTGTAGYTRVSPTKTKKKRSNNTIIDLAQHTCECAYYAYTQHEISFYLTFFGYLFFLFNNINIEQRHLS